MSTKGELQTLNLELKQENEGLKDTVTILLKEVDKLQNVDRNLILNLALTPEQRILEVQIQNIEAISNIRLLTLEETRALDLHIKNKRLLDDKSTVNADYTKVPDGLTEADLLQIAGSVNGDSEKKSKRRGKSKTSSKDTVE
jgi:hypothetical protein